MANSGGGSLLHFDVTIDRHPARACR